MRIPDRLARPALSLGLLLLSFVGGCGDVASSAADLAGGADLSGSVAPDLSKSTPDLTVPADLSGSGGGGGFPVVLGGGQEVPPVATAGAGTATVAIDQARTRIDVTLDVGALANVTAAHIHFGKVGVNGPVLFPLAGSSFASPLTRSLAAADLSPDAADGVNTFSDALDAIAAGRTYVNVHTVESPGGALRGQIGPVTLKVVLSNQQEVPPVEAANGGSATVAINAAHDAIDVTLDVGQVQNLTAAHIHYGPTGVNGPILLPLAGAGFASPLQKTLKAADLMPDAADGVNTFGDAINALLAGSTYVNVHTMASPGGAARGQVGKASLRAAASAGQESGVVSDGTGAGSVDLDGEHTRLAARLAFSGLSGDITAAHLHVARAGTAGPVVLPLAGGATPSPLSKTLTAADLMAQAGAGINTFDDAIDAALGGRLYFNVHTQKNPGGEIRGQLGNLVLKATLDGAHEVPPVNTQATGSAVVTVSGYQDLVTVTLTTTNLQNPTAAHIHAGGADANGGVLLAIATAAFQSPVKKVLSATDLMPSQAFKIATLADAINAMLSGTTYVNTHTQANPGGEIRGQLGP